MRSNRTPIRRTVAALFAPPSSAEPSDPPLRLIMVATALGMIVGALAAPASTPAERGVGAHVESSAAAPSWLARGDASPE